MDLRNVDASMDAPRSSLHRPKNPEKLKRAAHKMRQHPSRVVVLQPLNNPCHASVVHTGLARKMHATRKITKARGPAPGRQPTYVQDQLGGLRSGSDKACSPSAAQTHKGRASSEAPENEVAPESKRPSSSQLKGKRPFLGDSS